MTNVDWQPMTTAPKDGTFILLRGGREYADQPVPPCVVAFWDVVSWDLEESGWVYAYWDGAWRSGYEEPTQWAPLP